MARLKPCPDYETGLKPQILSMFMARLKPCPDYKLRAKAPKKLMRVRGTAKAVPCVVRKCEAEPLLLAGFNVDRYFHRHGLWREAGIVVAGLIAQFRFQS